MSLADISAGKTVASRSDPGTFFDRTFVQEQSFEWNFTENVPWKQQERQWPSKKDHGTHPYPYCPCSWYGGPCSSTLQSRLRWGLLEWLLASFLAHCIIEIIYQADLRKLFSHKIQLMGCVARGVLFFLSFRYDWYGYDRFIPEEGKIASAGLELSIDENLNWYAHAVEEDGVSNKHTSNIDFVQNHMQLTDMDTVLTIAEAGVTQAEKNGKLV